MNPIRQAMADGRPSFGVWVAGASATTAETIGRAGFEWALLDLQHGAINQSSLLPVIQAIELGGSAAMVRVPSNDPAAIGHALDLGAVGVVVPMISTPDQARRAAAAARYPPEGERSFGPIRGFRSVEESNTAVCLAMIETREGLQNIDIIAAVPGIDGLFVGPMDLGLSLGTGASMDLDPEVESATDAVIAAARRHGKFAGVAALGSAHAQSLLARGARILPIGSDVGHLRNALASTQIDIEGWTETFLERRQPDQTTQPQAKPRKEGAQ